MIIQEIIFPIEDICNEAELFFRGPITSDIDNAKIIEAGERVAFDTYFNAFSAGKWFKYTDVDRIKFAVDIEGQYEIRFFGARGKREILPKPGDNTKVIHSLQDADIEELDYRLHSDYISLAELRDYDIVYPVIEAKSQVLLKNMAWTCNSTIQQDVKFALCICTFNRQEALDANVFRIRDNIINNDKSCLYNNVEIFISDNGQNLQANRYESQLIHIYPNKNLGGAGGFTRAMIESIIKPSDLKFTHAILMDDDIELDVRVLERNYHFLQHIKRDYSQAMIGGDLFSLNKRYELFEAGARFEGNVIQSFNQLWDMRQSDAVAANEIENPINFNGWWYCCIPSSYIRKDNLPIPVFIHRDDVEYGVRNHENGTILLNGIAVWHPQGPNKAANSMMYYDTRNDLIAMCAFDTKSTKEDFVDRLTRLMLGYLLRYKYKAIDCMFYAVEDFYKGPEAFMELDTIENHSKLTMFNYVDQSPEELGVDISNIQHVTAENSDNNIFMKSAILSWVLPARNTTRVCGLDDLGLPLGAKKLYVYDESKGLGLLTEKSYSQAFRIVFKYFKIRRIVLKKHDAMMQEWTEKKPQYTSYEFWEKYLDI